MLQSIDKKKKLFTYLFLLFFLTTINNLSISNYGYLKLKINQIKVYGLNDESNFNISEELHIKYQVLGKGLGNDLDLFLLIFNLLYSIELVLTRFRG